MIRVLVADDHPIVRSGLVGLLDMAEDIEIVGEASTAQEAIDRTLSTHPDLVLMDLRMPGEDDVGLGGIHATRAIVEKLSATRVLVLTTYESDDHILSAIESGASGYLIKAAPAEEILTGVRTVAGGETALAPSIAAKLVTHVRGGAENSQTPSARELDVLRLVADGCSNSEIAGRLYIGEATVKTHLLHLFDKLDVSDRTRAVTRAIELGLI